MHSDPPEDGGAKKRIWKIVKAVVGWLALQGLVVLVRRLLDSVLQ
ncbi:hypothetical protein [Streptomyces yangpuensis]